MRRLYKKLTTLNVIVGMIVLLGLMLAIMTRDVVTILADIIFFITVSLAIYDSQKGK